MPRFSIIIPVFNTVKYLASCLDSVLCQSFTDWECICVDDGSFDGSATILDGYAAKDYRIKVIHQDNHGVADARNLALDMAKGEWITWLDADDLYAPWRLEEAVAIIEKHDPDLIQFKFEMSTAHQDSEWGRRGYVVRDGPEAVRWSWDVMVPMGMMWTMVMRRSLFVNNRFISGMRIKEECPVCARIANRVTRVVQSESRAYFYRQLTTSAMKSLRSVQDCVRLFDAVAGLWREGCATTPIARARLRVHCEDDLIDWAINHQKSDNLTLIWEKYQELKTLGIFAVPRKQRIRYRFPLWWFDKSGSIGLIVFISWVVFKFRKLRLKCLWNQEGYCSRI